MGKLKADRRMSNEAEKQVPNRWDAREDLGPEREAKNRLGEGLKMRDHRKCTKKERIGWKSRKVAGPQDCGREGKSARNQSSLKGGKRSPKRMRRRCKPYAKSKRWRTGSLGMLLEKKKR